MVAARSARRASATPSRPARRVRVSIRPAAAADGPCWRRRRGRASAAPAASASARRAAVALGVVGEQTQLIAHVMSIAGGCDSLFLGVTGGHPRWPWRRGPGTPGATRTLGAWIRRPTTAYLDHAASTPVRPEALAAMLPFLERDLREPVGRPRRRPGREDRARRRPASRSRRISAPSPARSSSPPAGPRPTTSPSRARPAPLRERGLGDGVVVTRVRAQGGARGGRPPRPRGLPGHRGAGHRTAGIVDLDALAAGSTTRTVAGVGDAREQRGRHGPAARRGRPHRARAGAAGAVAHRRGAGRARGSTSRRSPPTPTGVGVGPQARRSEGNRRARRPRGRPARPAARGRRSGARAPRRARATSRAPSGSRPRSAATVADAGRDHGARRSAPRPARSPACGDDPRAVGERRSRRRRSPATCTSASRASRPRRCSCCSTGPACAPPPGSSCSSGATEPSHVLAAMGLDRVDALGVDPPLARLRVRRRPTSTASSRCCRARSRSSWRGRRGAMSRARGARRDERRRRLVGRGRAARGAGPRRDRA